jgi:hypothetical protein
MPCPSHPPWLDHSNYTWGRIQVIKLLNTHFSPNNLSRHLSLGQIFSSRPCSQTPSVCVPPLMSETKFHTHKKTTDNIKFCLNGLNGRKHYPYSFSS